MYRRTTILISVLGEDTNFRGLRTLQRQGIDGGLYFDVRKLGYCEDFPIEHRFVHFSRTFILGLFVLFGILASRS